MNKLNILFVVLIIVILTVSGVHKYNKLVVNRDFMISNEIDCDPETESCFIYDCNLEEYPEECEEYPYKYIYTSAAETEYCDPYASDDCEELTCLEDSEVCEIIECSPDTVSFGESCTF